MYAPRLTIPCPYEPKNRFDLSGLPAVSVTWCETMDVLSVDNDVLDLYASRVRPPGSSIGHHRRLKRACSHLRQGRAVILMDAEREGEGDIAFAGSCATAELVNFCLSLGKGLLCLSLCPRDAERLGVEPLPSNGRDPFQTRFGVPIDVDNGTSGVSARSRAETIRAASDPASNPSMFVFPGHVHTLIAHPLGSLGRSGHTEAILDLLACAGMSGPGVLCEILDRSGDIASIPTVRRLARTHSLPIVDVAEVRDVRGRSLR